MPIEVNLFLPSADLVAPLLALSPDASVVELTGADRYAVCDLQRVALAQDYYGNVSALPSELAELLTAYESENVLWFDDLAVPSESTRVWEFMLGVWRPNFLRYVKATARSARAEMRVRYEHERGDHPYETAHWTFDFSDPRASFESLAVTDYDGGPPLWTATTDRFAGGEVQARYERYV